MTFLAVSGVMMILILVGMLFLIPTQSGKTKKKKKQLVAPPPPEQELTDKITRLEKSVCTLRGEIQTLQAAAKAHEQELALEKAKVKKFQEKISQEREWHQREQAAIDNKGKEYQQVKQELSKVQELYSAEHSANLRFEHELKEMKQQHDDLNAQRRALESENAQLKAQIENHRREIGTLKKDNAELAKKKEDASWIAKAEYDRVTHLLKQKEKELEQITRNPPG